MRRHWSPDDPLRRHLEQAWLTNEAFLIGFQYLTWDPVQRQLVYAQTPSLRWRARAVRNMIRSYVEQDVATAGQFEPEWGVRPKNTDPENYDSAEVGEAVLSHYWRETRMPSKKYDLYYHVFVKGNAFLKIAWDRCAGDQIAVPSTMQFGEESVDTLDRMFLGDVASDVISPLEVYVDNYARRVEDLRWMIHARAVPLAYVEEQWPDRSRYVTPGLDENGLLGRQRFVLDLMGPAGSFGGPRTIGQTREDWVMLKEFYEKPSIYFPKGRYIAVCNDVCMEEPRDNPTPKGELPFVMVRHMLVPDRVWAQCNVDNLLSLQRSYNRYVSKKEEHVVLTANAKLLEHATNDLPASSFDTEIGEIVKWNGVQPPHYLEMPTMPPESETEMQRCKQDFDLVTSQSAVVRGQYPGKVSGKMVNILVEQNNMLKTPFLVRLAESMKQWGHLVLEVAQQNVVEPRLVKILGRDRQWSVKTFQGSDLRDNTEVEIDFDSVQPKSLTMTMDFIAQATQLGFMSPANSEHQGKFWRAVGMKDLAPLVEDKALDARKARNENKMLMSGMMVPPAEATDDHDIHVPMHVQQMKGDDYLSAPAVVQEMVKAHLQSHFEAVMPRAGVSVRQGNAGPPMAGGGAPTDAEPDEFGGPPQGGGGQQQVQFTPQQRPQQRGASLQPFT